MALLEARSTLGAAGLLSGIALSLGRQAFCVLKSIQTRNKMSGTSADIVEMLMSFVHKRPQHLVTWRPRGLPSVTITIARFLGIMTKCRFDPSPSLRFASAIDI
jgi:hypothetical protein